MTAQAGRWSDLGTRVGSALAMVVLAAGGIWAGGHLFYGLVALVCGAMVWELVRMLAPDHPGLALRLGTMAGAAVLLACYLPVLYALPVLVAGALVGMGQVQRMAPVYLIFCALLMIAGWGMAHVRGDLGAPWLLWLVGIVVLTDIAGYFAGRLIGGPKFWPAVSPKKTWSGTVAGWLVSALLGVAFAFGTGATWALVVGSVVLSFASQMGDIAESAIKRRAGVKDSSRLIPGHGGVLDRFDGMMGGALALLFLEAVLGFPYAWLL